MPIDGPAVQVSVKRQVLNSDDTCDVSSVYYATELDYSGAEIILATTGTPPSVWHEPYTMDGLGEKEALTHITQQLPKEYRSGMDVIDLFVDGSGWTGSVKWCCPDKDSDLYRAQDGDRKFEYRLPFTLSAENQAIFGQPTAEEVFMDIYDSNMEDSPVIRRDIDGDGKKEVYFTGCLTSWQHENIEFVSSTVSQCCC